MDRPSEAMPGGTQDVFYGRGSPVPLPMMERARGIYLWDEEGDEYMDASSGPMVSALGHGNEVVIEAMRLQATRLDYAYSRVARNPANLAYAERLTGLAGPGFERAFLCSGGSEAVEAAIKFLRRYAVATGQGSRRHVISLMPSYHGATVAASGMSGDDALGPLLDGFAIASAKVPAPLSYRLPQGHTPDSYAAACAQALEDKIVELGPANVLAFILEPVGGLATGAVVPPREYFRRVRDICSAHDVRLVFDEILCGAGRSGKFITAHHWPDALPDIIVVAKGLGAGYSPLGAMLAPASMVDELTTLGGFESSYSYNANPVSCAAGLAVLDEIDRLGLLDRAGHVGNLLRAGLEAIGDESPIVGDVRGLGMLLAVEIVADKESRSSLPSEAMPTERIRVCGLQNGVMLYSRQTSGGRFGHWFMVAPPMTITDEECTELLRRIQSSVRCLTDQLRQEGHI